MAFAGVIGAPLIWLAALQTGYVLAYQACDARSRAWVAAPTIGAVAILLVMLGITQIAERRSRHTREPQPLLSWLGVGVAAMMVVIMIASSIAPLVLRPCD
jgi:hypothetical protein